MNMTPHAEHVLLDMAFRADNGPDTVRTDGRQH